MVYMVTIAMTGIVTAMLWTTAAPMITIWLATIHMITIMGRLATRRAQSIPTSTITARFRFMTTTARPASLPDSFRCPLP